MWLSSFTSEILHRIEDERTMNNHFGGGWLDFNRLLVESERQTRVFFRYTLVSVLKGRNHPITTLSINIEDVNWLYVPTLS